LTPAATAHIRNAAAEADVIRAILSLLGFIFSWLTLGVVAIALGVGAILWVYARGLPDHEQLANYTPPTISRIYSSEGRLIDEFARERRLFVPAADIPDRVKHAFIAAEDQNFYTHQGYDPRGIAAALRDAIVTRGETLRGASTITQQVMKNFLLSGDRTGERKLKEIILAARIEQTLSKDDILELYLNEIFLGQNSFGVAAAARTYFNKTLEELTIPEAAYLAALPKAPSDYHPVRQHEAALDRRAYVLGRMFEDGYITEFEYLTASAAPLETVQSGEIESARASRPPRDHFTDEIRRQFTETLRGDLPGIESEEDFFTGGLSIRATMDPVLQDVAAAALREGLESYDRGRGRWHGVRATLEPEQLADEAAWRDALSGTVFPRDIAGWQVAVILGFDGADALVGVEGTNSSAANRIPADDVAWARADSLDELVDRGDIVHVQAVRDADGTLQHWSLRQIPRVQGAFMAMDVHTGRVLAMQGGFSWQASSFNRATQADRQPGSAFKPFVYAAALDSGYSPATIVVDAPIEVATADGIWRPKNASNRFYGPAPLRTGIERSRNLMTVRLARDLGMQTVAHYAERFGVYDEMGTYLANALGSEETTLFRMVAAYAMFANGGERVEPTLVDRIQDRYGNTIYRHDRRECIDCDAFALPDGWGPRIRSSRERVIDPITAYQLTSMLRGVVERGTAAGRVDLGVPTAGKTGTTNDAKDVWFVGFTSNIVAGCYMGYDEPTPMGSGAYGGTLCAPVFNTFMQEAVARYGGGRFEVPPGGVFAKIDRGSGRRLPDNASGASVVTEYFRDDGMQLALVGQVMGSVIDGGYAMGSDLPLFAEGQHDSGPVAEVTTSTGREVVLPPKPSAGALGSGGLY
jgi:penicillin-binding protein 1A